MKPDDPQIGDFYCSGAEVFVSNAWANGVYQQCVKQWADGSHGPGWSKVALATVADEIERRGLKLVTNDKAIAASNEAIAIHACTAPPNSRDNAQPSAAHGWDRAVAKLTKEVKNAHA